MTNNSSFGNHGSSYVIGLINAFFLQIVLDDAVSRIVWAIVLAGVSVLSVRLFNWSLDCWGFPGRKKK